jgi:mRNA-degrading endonuclease RelE of RelBE toxin-antitoxin system
MRSIQKQTNQIDNIPIIGICCFVQWSVYFNRKAEKKVAKLSEKKIKAALLTLIREIEINGPIRGNWPNYSKLGKERHHCHLTRSYVVVWEVIDKEIQIVEVKYIGTREKAPY